MLDVWLTLRLCLWDAYIDRRFDLSEPEVDTDAELDTDDKDPSRKCWRCEYMYASLTSFRSVAYARSDVAISLKRCDRLLTPDVAMDAVEDGERREERAVEVSARRGLDGGMKLPLKVGSVEVGEVG